MTSSAEKKEWTLKGESEIRCEVTEADPLVLKLISGTAEIFGVEMAVNKEYSFFEENFAVFSWYGCVIESTGKCQIYDSDSTPMISYVNTHAQLEAIRDIALANGDRGPRVIVVGPKDHGKSTTCKILASYAARLDRTPIFVDLDVGQGALSIPGCICAVPLEKSSLSIEEGFLQSAPLVYYFGHSSPSDNVKLYQHLVSLLAGRVDGRLERDADARASGVIINTAGWGDQTGYDVLLQCIQAFSVDVVLVMGHDKLYSKFSTDVGDHVTVVKLPKSGGVVERDSLSRNKSKKSRIREYFYGRRITQAAMSRAIGAASSLFSPARQDLRLSTLRLVRAGGVELSDGMRLIGETQSAAESVKLTRIQVSNDLVHCILAVLHIGEDEDSTVFSTADAAVEIPQQLLGSNIAGFLWVVQLDVERDMMTVLAPCPGALPSKYLLVGSLKWVE